MSLSAIKKASAKNVWLYTIGEGGVSIVTNGIANFAMVFYAAIASFSLSDIAIILTVSTFFDAVFGVIVGYFSDREKNLFYRRHIYMFFGAILTSVFFFLMWFPPEFITKSTLLFYYFLIVNIVFRIFLSIFVVPYVALGYEMDDSYNGRVRVQGFRYFISMFINIIFGAAAWIIFFPEVNNNGKVVDGTTVLSNYSNMAVILSLASFFMFILCILVTLKKNKYSNKTKNTDKSFFSCLGTLRKSYYFRKLFWLLCSAQFGIMIISQIQIFAYVRFLEFSNVEKTLIHGIGMIAFAAGAVSLGFFVERVGKKFVGYIAIFFSVLGGILIFSLFMGLIHDFDFNMNSLSYRSPITIFLFALFQTVWWGGCGIIIPLTAAMFADASEVFSIKNNGMRVDGLFSGMLNFCMKISSGLGFLVSFYIIEYMNKLATVGLISASVSRSIFLLSLSFLSGPIFLLIALIFLIEYPVTLEFFNEIKEKKYDLD